MGPNKELIQENVDTVRGGVNDAKESSKTKDTEEDADNESGFMTQKITRKTCTSRVAMESKKIQVMRVGV